MAYIATLKKNNTVIYPQTKSTAVYEDDGVTALDTVVVKKSTAAGDANKMIKADGTKALVGASNIDFSTFPNGDLVIGNTLTINRDYDFRIAIIGAISTWGYSGGIATVSIEISPTPTSISSIDGKTSGGDTVSRSVIAGAVCVCEANTTYSISVSRSNSGGATGDNLLIGIISRIS